MVMRVAWCLLGVLQTAVSQTAEASAYDGLVRALCDVTEGATALGNAPSQLNATADYVQQTGGTRVRVRAPGSPDAVWIKDEYGMILAYQANPSYPTDLDFSADAYGIILTAHYPSCHITQASAPLSTWKKLYNDYQSSDAASFSQSDGSLQAAATATAAQFSSIAYGAAPKTATVSFTQGAGVSVPHVYVRDNTGLVLSYTTGYAVPPTVPMTRIFTIEFGAAATALTACTLSCVTHDLAPEIVAGIESAGGTQLNNVAVCDSSTCALPTTLSGETLLVRRGATCPPASSATLFARVTAASPLLAFGTDQVLSVDVTNLTSILVKQQCGTALTSMVVDLPPLRQAYAAAMAAKSVGPTTTNGPLTCQYEGRSYGWAETWDGPDGAKCSCLQGVAECGGGLKRGIYFSGGGVAVVTISVVLIAIVAAATAYIKYQQRLHQRVATGRKKSFQGTTYHGSGLNAPQGQQEIELPAQVAGQVGITTNAV